ncbi:MAG: DUF21 domain-containing protein [Myxococcales bacterium]|nr:DUF21 domain-containing protein [Myxococcales bacterium]
MMAHVSQAPRPPSELRDDIPPALERLMLDALAKDPAARPPSCRDFRARLEEAIARERPRVAAAAAPAEIAASATGAGMVFVPGGEFAMGQKCRSVYLDAFYIDRTPVRTYARTSFEAHYRFATGGFRCARLRRDRQRVALFALDRRPDSASLRLSRGFLSGGHGPHPKGDVAAVNAGPGGLVVDIIWAAAVTALGSLFAAADAALNEIPESRMQALSARAEASGAAFRRFTADPLRILSRWLVARVIALSAASVLFNEVARDAGFHRLGLPLAVLGAILTYGTFTEVASTLARRRPERVGALALVFLRPLEWLLVPIADPLAVVGRAVDRRVPKSRPVDARITETEVEWAVSEGQKAGAIANEPAEMIRKVLDFKDLTAREVMVPRRHILGIEVTTPLADAIAFVAAEKHSRYPVYRENLDQVVGLLNAKDLFALMRDGRTEKVRLADVMRTPVLFVSENQAAAKILQDMRSRRLHMAVVSDEFGGTAGLVTLEDIIEEIVGDIRDEHDLEAPIQSMGDGRVVADAAVPLSQLAQALGKPLPDDGEFESLGGLIVSRAGRVPPVGASVQVDGLRLIVREADETRVVKVEIVPERAAPQPVT